MRSGMEDTTSSVDGDALLLGTRAGCGVGVAKSIEAAGTMEAVTVGGADVGGLVTLLSPSELEASPLDDEL